MACLGLGVTDTSPTHTYHTIKCQIFKEHNLLGWPSSRFYGNNFCRSRDVVAAWPSPDLSMIPLLETSKGVNRVEDMQN